jgi:aspartyl-tRNA(Asn)/glutamyl-tRNA(Gln) amidotransferase subunit C
MDEKEFKRLAWLSRLHFEKDEIEGFCKDVEIIAQNIKNIDNIDTDGVEVTEQIIPMTNVFREDVVKIGLGRDLLLRCAVEKSDGCYLVPKVVD